MKKEKYFTDTVCVNNDNYMEDKRLFFIHSGRLFWLHEDEYFVDYLHRIKPIIIWKEVRVENVKKFFWYIICGYGGIPDDNEIIKNTTPKLTVRRYKFSSVIIPDSILIMRFNLIELKTRTKHNVEVKYYYKTGRIDLLKMDTESLKANEIRAVD